MEIFLFMLIKENKNVIFIMDGDETKKHDPKSMGKM